MPPAPPLSADVVVAGGGMGGLTAANAALDAGARVVLLEKAAQVGGSAAVSGGTLWCASDLDAWLSEQPGGDPALGTAQVDGFHEGITWLADRGVKLKFAPDPAPYRFRREVYRMLPDAAASIATLAHRFTAAGGTIFTRASLRDIIRTPDGVTAGVRATTSADTGGDHEIEIAAPSVILATGGFQASDALRAEHLGAWSHRMIVRANPESAGDGLQAALRAGAATAGPFDRFYGHLVPAPPARVGLHNYAQVKPTFGQHAVLVNLRGERFDDEFVGDEIVVHSAARQEEGWVFMLYDQSILNTGWSSGGLPDQRIRAIRDAGGEVLEAVSLTELAGAMAARWGIQRDRLLATLDEYNAAARAGDPSRLPIPKSGGLVPLEHPPMCAIRFAVGITFTYGGARIDPAARVLDTKATPIPGLFACGADAGGIYTRGYTGGLSLGLAFGLIAGRGAASHAQDRRSVPALAKAAG